VWAGGYIGSWMQFGTPDWVAGYVPVAAAGLERDAAGGKLVRCGGDAMIGSGSGIPGGGGMGLEQFVSHDPDDEASMHAAYLHMEDAVKDAASIGYPPGKEWQYLQMGWSDERFEQVMAAAPQPDVFRFQRRIKSAFDPNDVGDRMYPTLPLGPERPGKA
jgi:hypothetical protein